MNIETWRDVVCIGGDPPAVEQRAEASAASSNEDTPLGGSGGKATQEEDDGGSIPRNPAVHSAVRVLITRSRLALAMKDVLPYANILIIEDVARDADRLASTLRLIFGYELKVRHCRTLGTALDAVLDDQPDLVFLDDRMGPLDRAEKSVPFLRTANCHATIIVASGHVDRRRRAELLNLGVGDVIDKDELDSLSICQALINALRQRGS